LLENRVTSSSPNPSLTTAVDVDIPHKALALRLEDVETDLRSQAAQLQHELKLAPTVIEVAQETFVSLRGGRWHRQSSKLTRTPPEFWTTTCGIHFAGSRFELLNAADASQSKLLWCTKCTAPAIAATGQVGVILAHTGVEVLSLAKARELCR
ncbi:MAG: hypothetical protein OSB41_14105, partial [Kiritimatiellae bacterium]|nr:hypothetical protein [Kiritimatiellia bacterium]